MKRKRDEVDISKLYATNKTTVKETTRRGGIYRHYKKFTWEIIKVGIERRLGGRAGSF